MHLLLTSPSHKRLTMPGILCPTEVTRNHSHLIFDGLKQAGSTCSLPSSRNNEGQIFLQIQKIHPQCQHHSYDIHFRSAYFVSSPLMAKKKKLIRAGPAPSGPHGLCPQFDHRSLQDLDQFILDHPGANYIVRHMGGVRLTLVKRNELGPMREADKSITATVRHLHREN